jgi:hypothetical protein
MVSFAKLEPMALPPVHQRRGACCMRTLRSPAEALEHAAKVAEALVRHISTRVASGGRCHAQLNDKSQATLDRGRWCALSTSATAFATHWRRSAPALRSAVLA